jgi:hypothetical protein
MLILNFSHPLTEEQQQQTMALLEVEQLELRDIKVHIDRSIPMGEVARDLAEAAKLSSHEWQSLAFVINPPGLAPLALALVAEIHGRSGGFPSMLNLRPIADAVPTRYELAEVVNLQQLRNQARSRR